MATTNEELPKQNGKGGRGKNGKFTSGNPGGPGNPHLAQVARIREALYNTVDSARFARIVDKMATLAERGNVDAAKFVTSYLLGKPKEQIELTGKDGESLEMVVTVDASEAVNIARRILASTSKSK